MKERPGSEAMSEIETIWPGAASAIASWSVQTLSDMTRGRSAALAGRARQKHVEATPIRYTNARSTPLWPAGHLPLKGGDFAVISRPPSISDVACRDQRVRPG